MILALRIGTNTAVFSVVDPVMLQPLPYDSPERLVRIEENAPKRPMSGVTAEDYLRWKDRTDLFEKTVPFIRDTVTLTGDGDPVLPARPQQSPGFHRRIALSVRGKATGWRKLSTRSSPLEKRPPYPKNERLNSKQTNVNGQ